MYDETECSIVQDNVAASPDVSYCRSFSSSDDVALAHNFNNWAVSAPATPITLSMPSLDSFSTASANSSPAPATPQLLYSPSPWSCPEVYVVAESVHPNVVANSVLPEPAAPKDVSVDMIATDGQLEDELLALLESTPCPPPLKLTGKDAKRLQSKTNKRTTASSRKPKKRKAVSANAVLAALGITNACSFLTPRREKGADSPVAGSFNSECRLRRNVLNVRS